MNEFDPRTTLDITEDSINELLANVTISALSLDTWFANVTVKNTETPKMPGYSLSTTDIA
jgi:hypothetical protein